MINRQNKQGSRQQFKYEQVSQLQLHQLVRSILICSKNSTPYFPPLFSKKLCQNEGLECNESVFFNLISNVIDYKLNQCVSEIKQNSGSASSKKQSKDLTFKTIDMEKYFAEKEVKLARPRLYPQLQVNFNADDNLIPKQQSNK